MCREHIGVEGNRPVRMMRIFSRTFWRSDEPTVLGMHPRQAVLHFIGIPLLLAFLSGWPQVGRTIAWSKAHALGFWMGMSLSGWWLNDIVTRLIAQPLRERGVPLWGTLVIAVFISAFPTDIVLRAWVIQYHAVFPYLPVDRPLPGWQIDMDLFFKTHIYAYLTWPLINLAMYHLWKTPWYGYLPDQAGASTGGRGTASGPAFLAKIGPAAQGAVLALGAEQHYLRVYTDRGEALILYRLSDAIRELGSRGMQVHRSYWVASGAVRDVLGGATLRLKLINGIEVPVSRSFRRSVEMANFLKEGGPHAPPSAGVFNPL